jgi:Zn-dependent protease
VYDPNPYRSELLYDSDLRGSPGPLRAIIAQVNWEFIAGFIILIGFSVFALWQGLPSVVVPATVGFIVVGWVFSLCLHEFAHAATAYIGGDHSQSTRNYLSFNPLRYLHPVFSIVLPLAFLLLGGIPLPGGAVYLNRSLVRSRIWQSAISLAGPLMNLLVAILASIPFWVGVTAAHPALANALALLVFFEVLCVILNLLPIPPLDGFGIISPWLPRDLRNSLYSFASYSVLLIFAALWFVPPIEEAFFLLVFIVMAVLRVDPGLVFQAGGGLDTFQFWLRQ